ncbi:uncharacterized protein LOC110979483 [Acanthaster planci]|uniref:Uncharacterized protein LOC110979483 n=1 Tax=Acanthaster planci TaxID=133434 RepID=A0A8B7YEK0_ACAPL|nr:uncharacterized protein LOC110979483 [Acanthaster planci]
MHGTFKEKVDRQDLTMAGEHTEQVRILIWCTARSLSTVLARSLSQYPASQCLLELFGAAANFGPDRRFPETELLQPRLSFKFVKELYEQPWAGKSLVLGKELSYVMIGKQDMIPEGYQHVFLIRNPQKSVKSLEDRMSKVAYKKKKEFYLGLNQFKNLSEMHQHVTKTLGKKALVLDADDLKSNPSEMLQCLCTAVGLQFTDKLLEWDKVSGVPGNWMVNEKQWEDHERVGWFDRLLESTGFNPLETDPRVCPSEGQPSPHFKQMIAEALPYYQELYQLRIKPQQS